MTYAVIELNLKNYRCIFVIVFHELISTTFNTNKSRMEIKLLPPKVNVIKINMNHKSMGNLGRTLSLHNEVFIEKSRSA